MVEIREEAIVFGQRESRCGLAQTPGGAAPEWKECHGLKNNRRRDSSQLFAGGGSSIAARRSLDSQTRSG